MRATHIHTPSTANSTLSINSLSLFFFFGFSESFCFASMLSSNWNWSNRTWLILTMSHVHSYIHKSYINKPNSVFRQSIEKKKKKRSSTGRRENEKKRFHLGKSRWKRKGNFSIHVHTHTTPHHMCTKFVFVFVMEEVSKVKSFSFFNLFLLVLFRIQLMLLVQVHQFFYYMPSSCCSVREKKIELLWSHQWIDFLVIFHINEHQSSISSDIHARPSFLSLVDVVFHFSFFVPLFDYIFILPLFGRKQHFFFISFDFWLQYMYLYMCALEHF